jgi:hypothetical protein
MSHMETGEASTWNWWRRLVGATLRVLLGVGIGVTLGALFWLALLLHQRNGIWLALQGEAAYGTETLIAFVAIGVLVGTGIGLIWGLSWIAETSSSSGNHR